MKHTKKTYSKKRVINKSYNKRKGKGRGGGCGCKNLAKKSRQSGGGDFFLAGYKEPPSFNNVPISSFYPQNTYNAGADVQSAQISSRGLPNMLSGGQKSKNLYGGKKSKNNKNKNKTSKRNKKMKGGAINYSLFTQDPILGTSVDPISSGGNTSGIIQASNIFNQGGVSNYASSNANMKATLLV